MRLLLIKTSSLGDIIHTLPALNDAFFFYPDLKVDWVVEENFVDIPNLHPGVSRVIPVAFRRWRKKMTLQALAEFNAFRQWMGEQQYDLILDAQGLIKSAAIACMTKGLKHGLGFHSIREPLASFAYHQRFNVPKGQHAIEKLRQLFGMSLSYDYTSLPLFYNIDKSRLPLPLFTGNYVVFCQGTSWHTKKWPVHYWKTLATFINSKNCSIVLPWANLEEHITAQNIASACSQACVLPALKLNQIAAVLSHASACVTVDTGLGHLASALGIPTFSLYGPTSPLLTGTCGPTQTQISAQFPCAPCFRKHCLHTSASNIFPPCYDSVSPEKVWQLLKCIL